jgi:hypothetical protein
MPGSEVAKFCPSQYCARLGAGRETANFAFFCFNTLYNSRLPHLGLRRAWVVRRLHDG